MPEPCSLPLSALEAEETCPRCGELAKSHSGHRATTLRLAAEARARENQDLALQALARAEMAEAERDLVRELNEALRRRDAELVARVEKAERDRDATIAHHGELVDAMRDAIARAELAEWDRDEARAALATIRRVADGEVDHG